MKSVEKTLLTLIPCLWVCGCAHKLDYDSVNVGVSETTVPHGATVSKNLSQSLQDSPTGYATETPPFLVDHIIDAAHTGSAVAVAAPVELAKPTMRDIPPIVVNKSTDIVHDGSLAVGRKTVEILHPTARALGRSAVKLGDLFILRPITCLDDQVRSITDFLNQNQSYQNYR